jgi:hypothetical protein
MKTRTAYRVLMFANSAYLKKTYGEAFYSRFREVADAKLRELTPRLPALEGSPAAMSYAFITAYVPFFHAFRQFDETRETAGELLWVINENLFDRFPSAVQSLIGRMATSGLLRKSLQAAQLRGERGELDPMDWRMVVEEPAEGGYRTTWTQCGALQVLRAIGEDGVFPYACQSAFKRDPLWSHIGVQKGTTRGAAVELARQSG